MADDSKLQKFLDLGCEIAGSVVATGVGLLVAGPGGALGGAVAGPTLAAGAKKVISEMTTRSLSSREEKRVAAAAVFAIEKIKKKLDAGQKPREDGFIGDPTKRTGADEIFEGSLLKSKNEHEEKKIKYFSNIFVNSAFDSTISPGEANFLLKISENLSYRKFLILSVFIRKDEYGGISLRKTNFTTGKGIHIDTITILQEGFELYNSGLIACKEPDSSSYSALLGLFDIIPEYMVLTLLGRRVFELLGLYEIPISEISEVALKLQ